MNFARLSKLSIFLVVMNFSALSADCESNAAALDLRLRSDILLRCFPLTMGKSSLPLPIGDSGRRLWRCCLYPAFPLSPKQGRQCMSCPRCPASRSSVRVRNGQGAANKAALRSVTSPFSAENGGIGKTAA